MIAKRGEEKKERREGGGKEGRGRPEKKKEWKRAPNLHLGTSLSRRPGKLSNSAKNRKHSSSVIFASSLYYERPDFPTPVPAMAQDKLWLLGRRQSQYAYRVRNYCRAEAGAKLNMSLWIKEKSLCFISFVV